jgi:predicted nucleic acid-binding protein
MSFLLDTNVLSELSKPVPHPGVLKWFDRIPEEKLFLSVFTLGEIQSGIEKLVDGAKKNSLLIWFDELQEAFSGNVLSFDKDTALLWGKTHGRLLKTGKPLPLMDSLIAAMALKHNMVLVSRNVPDFTHFGVDILNPWE